MTTSYALQFKDFIIILLAGFIIGIMYGIIKIPTKIKNNYIYQIFTDIFFVIMTTFIFILLINIINLGEIRLFLIIGYILGIIIERITLGKLFAKGFVWVYNKLSCKIKVATKSKLGRIIFK